MVKRNPRGISNVKLMAAVHLKQKGWSHNAIAKALDLKKSTVEEAIAHYHGVKSLTKWFEKSYKRRR